jgi:hypothetical protein
MTNEEDNTGFTYELYKKASEETPKTWHYEEDINDILEEAVNSVRNPYLQKALDEEKTPNDLWGWIYDAHEFVGKFYYAMSSYISSKDRTIWQHRNIDILQKTDEFEEVNYGQLKRLAADYLSNKDEQINYFDWLLLDGLLFLETKAAVRWIVSTNYAAFPTPQMAYVLSGGNWFAYYPLKVLFWLLRQAFNYILPIAGSYYLFTIGHEYMAMALLILPVWALLAFLIFFPRRWKNKKKLQQILIKRMELYNHLGGNVISPRRLKSMIADLIEMESNVDASIIAIVDRMNDRDPTAFLLE